MSNFVRNFKKFQSNKRNESIISENKKNTQSNKVNESVIERDNKFIINGITIPQSLVTGFASKLKKEQGKDILQDYSKKELAEELVRYIIDTHANVEDIPVSAILGGEPDMEDQSDDISMENDPIDVEDDGFIDDADDLDTEGGDEEDEDFNEEDVEGEEDEDVISDDFDDEFEGIDDEEDEDIDSEEDEDIDSEEDIDLPEGDPITSDDFGEEDEDEEEDEEEDERPRRRNRE